MIISPKWTKGHRRSANLWIDLYYSETIIAVLTYDQVIVGTATSSILKMRTDQTQILNFKVNFYKEFELF